jgi:hypothetical protein
MKSFKESTYKIVTAFLLCAIAGTAYLLGYQRGGGGSDRSASVLIDYTKIPKELVVSATSLSQKSVAGTEQKGVFFGSKSGTKYYGSTTCANAKRIKPENYVWFTTKNEAEIQGYTRGTC